jgi:AcrR family transcriptional regulator
VGREREFDIDRALDRAMLVFWTKGYDGASLSELTTAMGIHRPSLYAAFGSKEELFVRVLERYLEGPGSYMNEALAKPTAREVAEHLLRGAANLHTAAGTPGGCLGVHGALVGADASQPIREKLTAARQVGEVQIRGRLERAVAEGDLPCDADPAGLAAYLRAVTYGMAVQATSGNELGELESVIDVAMRGWPT